MKIRLYPQVKQWVMAIAISLIAMAPGDVFAQVAATNLALGKSTMQSSTGSGAGPERAVDGNLNGDLAMNSVAHTNEDLQAWWEVDLGSVYPLTEIRLYNRTDCCQAGSGDFYVLISDSPFVATSLELTRQQPEVKSYLLSGPLKRPTRLILARGQTGRYIRVQLVGQGPLDLAEVEAWVEEQTEQTGQIPGQIQPLGQAKDIAAIPGLAATGISGEQHLAVLLIDFPDSPVRPFTPQEASQLIFGSGQVNRFFQEASYGKVSLTGDVFGWYQLTRPEFLNGGCVAPGFANAGTEIMDILNALGVNILNYTHLAVLYQHSPDSPCVTSGFASGHAITVNGSIYSIPAAYVSNLDYIIPLEPRPFTWTYMQDVLSHELTHLFGVGHANGWECGTGEVLYGNACRHFEYGNEFDLMGGGTFALHSNAFHKGLLGWLGQENILSITGSGRYTISPLENSLAGYQAAKIVPLGYPYAPFYLEYRRGIGFDADLNDADKQSNQQGLMVNRIIPNRPDPELLDMSPRTRYWTVDGDAREVTLNLNQGVFQDPGKGVTIGPIISLNNSGITFDVTLSPPQCLRQPPNGVYYASLGYFSVLAGNTLKIGLPILNNDSRPCGSSTFEISPSLPNGWRAFSSGQVLIMPMLIPPEEIGLNDVMVEVPEDTPAGTYSVEFSARNQSSGQSNWIGRAYIIVQAQPPSIPPSVQPIAEYKFDETSGSQILDTSQYSNHGVFLGAPTRTVGRFGQALYFDSLNAAASAPNPEALYLKDQFSIALWMKADNLNQAPAYLLNKASSFAIIYAYNFHKLEFFSPTFVGDDPRPGSGLTVPDNAWHFLVYAYDGNLWKGYLDGLKVFSSPRTLSLARSADPLILGAAAQGLNHFQGQLDEVRLFNRALSDTEVLAFYQDNELPSLPVPNVPTNLIGNPISSGRIDLSWVDNAANETGFVLESQVGTGEFSELTGMPLGPNTTSFSDTTVSPSTTYTYRIKAVNGDASSAWTVSPPVTTPSIVTLSVYPPGPTYTTTQTITLTASASDNAGVGRVEFYDGVALKATDTAGPYIYSWPITSADNGSHTLSAKAYDAAGNVDSSNPLPLTVNIAPQPSLSGPVLSYFGLANAQGKAINPVAGTNIFVPAVGTGFQIIVEAQKGSSGKPPGTRLPTTSSPSISPDLEIISDVPLGDGNPMVCTGGVPAAADFNNPTALKDFACGFRVGLVTYNANNISAFLGPTFPVVPTQYHMSVTTYTQFPTDRPVTLTVQVKDGDGKLGAPKTIQVHAGGLKTPPSSAPEAPTNLTYTATTSQIALSWVQNVTPENRTEKFIIERSPTGQQGSFTVITELGPSSRAYTNSNLSPGTTYYYQFKAGNSVGDSPYSALLEAKTLTAPPVRPPTPSNLRATVSGQEVRLSWTDNASANSNEAAYLLQRQEGIYSSYITLNPAPLPDTTSWTDAGVSPNKTYRYRLQASNSAGLSSYAYSNSVTMPNTPPIPPAAPEGLEGTVLSSTQVRLNWQDRSTNESGFKIERSLDGASFTQVASAATNATSYTNSNLSPQNTYWYQVRAVNAGGVSQPSNIISVATPEAPPEPPGPNITYFGLAKSDGSAVLPEANTLADGTKVYKRLPNISFRIIVEGEVNTSSRGLEIIADTTLGGIAPLTNAASLFAVGIVTIDPFSGNSVYLNRNSRIQFSSGYFRISSPTTINLRARVKDQEGHFGNWQQIQIQIAS